MVRFTFEDKDGNEFGSYTTLNRFEAKVYAQRHGLRMIANTYVLGDSEVVEDFTQLLTQTATKGDGR
jgi:hypothetical protein